jgi:hypothetical protein
MKATKALFFELMYDFQSNAGMSLKLPKLSLRELLALAKLLGCPSCGSKEAVTVRLLAHRELRLKLSRFADNPVELANSYQRESLRDMCWEAGICWSGNKRALGGPPFRALTPSRRLHGCRLAFQVGCCVTCLLASQRAQNRSILRLRASTNSMLRRR